MTLVVEMATTKEEQAMVAEVKTLAPDYLTSMGKLSSALAAGKVEEAKEIWLSSRDMGTKLDEVLDKESNSIRSLLKTCWKQAIVRSVRPS